MEKEEKGTYMEWEEKKCEGKREGEMHMTCYKGYGGKIGKGEVRHEVVY